MRSLSAFLIALAGLAVASAHAETATTDPVGVMKLVITPSPGSGEAQFSFKGLGLASIVEFQGVATENVTVSGNTITCSTANWTDSQFNGSNGKYYLEILGTVDTPGAGTMYDIATTNGGTKMITLDQSLKDTITGKPSFRIRKHWTIGRVFGDTNSAGLLAGSLDSADQIMIYTADGFVSYYYSDGGLTGVGWRTVNEFQVDQKDKVIYPDDGIVIARKGSTTLSIILVGAVKTGQTSFPVPQGYALFANPYPAAMTLESSKLFTGDPTTGLAAGDSSSADQVLIFNGTVYDTYYCSEGGIIGTGWKKAGTPPADGSDPKNTVLPAGGSFLIYRQNGQAFNWVAPQHPSSY